MYVYNVVSRTVRMIFDSHMNDHNKFVSNYSVSWLVCE